MSCDGSGVVEGRKKERKKKKRKIPSGSLTLCKIIVHFGKDVLILYLKFLNTEPVLKFLQLHAVTAITCLLKKIDNYR